MPALCHCVRPILGQHPLQAWPELVRYDGWLLTFCSTMPHFAWIEEEHFVRFSIVIVSQGRGCLGYDYRYSLTSLLYATVASSSRDYCDFLHDIGFEARGRHFRLLRSVT